MTDEKKIIIDEDWKSQVQSEKEQAEQQRGEPTGSEPAGTGGDQPMPPADFQTIVSLLATQVMVSLGALPNPMSGEADVHPIHAKHFIDLLGVLQEKTKGNLSPEEDQGLESLMHELRMGFLAVQNMPADPNPAPPAVAGDAEENA
ncbi:MAG: DUF1844 domain-containing protein [Pirellulales bacterium]|nr:DUF1844 domain-containing protein [Pirellulales bacterium]